jgi:hypothetical protein
MKTFLAWLFVVKVYVPWVIQGTSRVWDSHGGFAALLGFTIMMSPVAFGLINESLRVRRFFHEEAARASERKVG